MSDTLDELKQVELNLLKAFIEICKKHDLQYYIIGGTLLGAIRHKGFIPWDDDIDVGMPRVDYEKFMELAQGDLPAYYFVQNFHTDPEYPLCFGKLRDSRTTFIESSVKSRKINHGVYIDIFPLDYYPKKNVVLFRWKNLLYSARISRQFDSTPSAKMRVMQIISMIFCPSVKAAIVKREALAKKEQSGDLIANLFGAWGQKEIMRSEWYGKGLEASFESVKVMIPEKYDEYLIQLYGDYMTPPPKDKQVGHHYTEVIDLNRPYTAYLHN